MTHLLCDHDNIGESVAWRDDVFPTCSADLNEVDCVACLKTFLDYGHQVRERLRQLGERDTRLSSDSLITSHT